MTACPKQSLPAVKAGVYTRISSDPSGQRAGVERQRRDCEAHCLARGWEVVEVFCDYADLRVMPTFPPEALRHRREREELSA